jgi:hypothetical protein
VTTFATDVSYYQDAVNDDYPHHWFIFRGCDGTFVDPKFSVNHAWAKKATASGKLAGFTVYVVYRPGVNVLDVLKGIVGLPHPKLTVMIDVESWSGQIRGDYSAGITALANGLAAWLGDKRRVLAYGNQGDLANLYPDRPSWLRLVVASYGSVKPNVHNMIGWQYSDGESRWPVPTGYPRSTPPFGRCDHNVFPGLSPSQLADALGVGTPAPAPAPPIRKRPDMFVYRVDMATAPKGTSEPGWHLKGSGTAEHIRGLDGKVNNGSNLLAGLGQKEPITVSYQQHLAWKAAKV